jgi:hypothetical protein
MQTECGPPGWEVIRIIPTGKKWQNIRVQEAPQLRENGEDHKWAGQTHQNCHGQRGDKAFETEGRIKAYDGYSDHAKRQGSQLSFCQALLIIISECSSVQPMQNRAGWTCSNSTPHTIGP